MTVTKEVASGRTESINDLSFIKENLQLHHFLCYFSLAFFFLKKKRLFSTNYMRSQSLTGRASHGVFTTAVPSHVQTLHWVWWEVGACV